jgi:hypothetical protein
MPESLAVASISKVGGVSAIAVSLPATEAAVEAAGEEAAGEEAAGLGADDEVAAGVELELPPVPEHATSAIEIAAASMAVRKLRLWAS